MAKRTLARKNRRQIRTKRRVVRGAGAGTSVLQGNGKARQTFGYSVFALQEAERSKKFWEERDREKQARDARKQEVLDKKQSNV